MKIRILLLTSVVVFNVHAGDTCKSFLALPSHSTKRIIDTAIAANRIAVLCNSLTGHDKSTCNFNGLNTAQLSVIVAQQCVIPINETVDITSALVDWLTYQNDKKK